MRKRLERLRLSLFDKMCALARRGLLRWIPDAPFLRIQYFLKLGRILHLKRPRLYTEKLQWIKLHDRKAEYALFADKLAVRDHVRKIAGEKYLIPMIARYDRPSQIDWDALPARFVVKSTHGSSSNIIVTDKTTLSVREATDKLNGWAHRNWFDISREWPYRNIEPRVLIERFIGGPDGTAPFDYKILCFEGEPVYIVVDADRYSRHTRNYYDVNWCRQDMLNRHPAVPYQIGRPAQLDEMLALARALARGLHHIRVDLYVVDGAVYFGEMTFFHGFGMEAYHPESFELHMGDLIHLPKQK